MNYNEDIAKIHEEQYVSPVEQAIDHCTLDGRADQKISKRHFFQDIKNSFHRVPQIGLKLHQIFFPTNMVARGTQIFCLLEGATDTLIEE